MYKATSVQQLWVMKFLDLWLPPAVLLYDVYKRKSSQVLQNQLEIAPAQM